MDFRAPMVAAQLNANAVNYFTKNLSDPEAGRRLLADTLSDLGHAVDMYPDWHPLLTAPAQKSFHHVGSLSQIDAYRSAEHTKEFVRGFITCPYSEARADALVDAVRPIPGIHAARLDGPLYMDTACPVLVEALDVTLEADGTIRSRDALAWFAQQSVRHARQAQVAETWWNMRGYALGHPHGSRSSLFVNQHTGVHMRKILEALNNSGMFGPIKEDSLDMLTQKKRDAINETLLRAAVSSWDKVSATFDFALRDEICTASVRDTWNDGMELSIRIVIGDNDLNISGFYYAESEKYTYLQPRGRRALAEKFI